MERNGLTFIHTVTSCLRGGMRFDNIKLISRSIMLRNQQITIYYPATQSQRSSNRSKVYPISPRSLVQQLPILHARAICRVYQQPSPTTAPELFPSSGHHHRRRESSQRPKTPPHTPTPTHCRSRCFHRRRRSARRYTRGRAQRCHTRPHHPSS